MLSVLHIENIAVIEKADIQFTAGFNVLTGETGAGKSIVIDAINAVLGERTPRDLIRTGAASAFVSAVFTGVGELDWFAENGLPHSPEDELLLQREIYADGKNVCRVSGRPVTVTQLRGLGRRLLNIHGQHDGQQLLDPACHIGYLDAFGGTQPLLEAYRQDYEALAALQRELDSLRMDEMEKSRKIDLLTYQIGELERAELRPGEDEELNEKKQLLRSAGKLTEAVETALTSLYGGQEEGAVNFLGTAVRALMSGGRYSQELSQLGEELGQLQIGVADVAERLEDLRRGFDFSPAEVDALEGRLDVIYRLRKKYGSTVEDMLAYLERSKEELEAIQQADGTIAMLERKKESLLKQAREKAEKLSEVRRERAGLLERRIQQELSELDMPRVRFAVQFTPKGGELGLDATGMDEIIFLLSANVGEDLKPLHKIASGGELARIMLALKNVLAETDDVGTLVFDEVDTGVSGRAAQKVGRKMADVARKKQVLCVTHLAQIAALADTHFSVEKRVRESRTYTWVEHLTRPQRVEELARLSGGETLTDAIRSGAEDLLRDGENYIRNQTGK